MLQSNDIVHHTFSIGALLSVADSLMKKTDHVSRIRNRVLIGKKGFPSPDLAGNEEIYQTSVLLRIM